MEIAVPIKDRLCRAALNMRSNACCRCTPRWWKKHRWTTTPWYPSPPPETLFPLRHVRIQCTKSKLSRDLSNPFAWQILESRWFSLVTKSMRTKRNSHFTTHEKNTIEIYPSSNKSLRCVTKHDETSKKKLDHIFQTTTFTKKYVDSRS